MWPEEFWSEASLLPLGGWHLHSGCVNVHGTRLLYVFDALLTDMLPILRSYSDDFFKTRTEKCGWSIMVFCLN